MVFTGRRITPPSEKRIGSSAKEKRNGFQPRARTDVKSQRIPKPHSPSSSLGGASNQRTPKSGDVESKPLSRQQKWQLKQKRLGNCRQCGKPAVVGSVHCAKHLRAKRKKNRLLNDNLPQAISGLGRPALPLVTRKEAQQ